VARRFTSASNEFANVAYNSDLALASGDFTVAGWIYIVSHTNYGTPFQQGSHFSLYISTGAVGYYRVGGGEGGLTYSPDWTDGEWQHLIWARSGSSNVVYRNAVSCATFTDGGTTTNTADWTFAYPGQGGSYMDASYAEWGVWKGAALDAGERASLNRGVVPSLVRPASLVGYWPFIGRTSPEPELWRGRIATLTGSTQISHPRVIYPHRRQVRRYTAGGAPASGGARLVGSLLVNNSRLTRGRLVLA